MTCLPMFAKCLPMAIMCFKASLKQIKKMFAKCLPQNRCICKDVCQIYPLGYLANVANDSILALLLEKVVCQSIRIKKRLANDFLGYLIVIS